MIEGSEDFGLPFEAGQPVGVRGKGVGQSLESDLAAQLRVAGLPDFAHAAFSERAHDFKGAETRTDR
jgi:hypothetical protein